jgi:hypothetical protein
MLALRLQPMRLHSTGVIAAGLVATGAALLALLPVQNAGVVVLLAPLGVALLVIVMRRPILTVTLVVGLTVLCEGPGFGILTFSSKLYSHIGKDLTVLDGLVVLAVLSVGLDLIRHRRPLRVPGPLALPLTILALAMAVGVVTGHANGGSLRFVVLSEDVLAYLLMLPLAVANLELDQSQIRRLLIGATALAGLKAVLGLIEVAGHFGQPIEGTATLTYYEPTANWIVMVVLFGVVAAVLARARPPRWVLLSSPLLIASLLFSYRRSFWIGAVLGLLLVLLVGTRPAWRRLLLPAGLGVAVAIWALGSVNFQAQVPVLKRVASLNPSKLATNAEDRYRLDERANVLAEIRAHPITGLGMTIPWAATATPLSVEHEGGREYVHFAALWYWLKLGVLGLVAYVGLLISSVLLAWRAWRRSADPWLRAFALASVCGLVALMVIETTGSFTGVDPRFTVLFAAQLGILAQAVRLAGDSDQDTAAPSLAGG